jgi:predicted DNA-binding transcriptional regulator AlpA
VVNTVKLSGELYERADTLKTRLGVGDMTLWRLVNQQGMARPVKIGRWRFYRRDEVDAWFLQRAAE